MVRVVEADFNARDNQGHVVARATDLSVGSRVILHDSIEHLWIEAEVVGVVPVNHIVTFEVDWDKGTNTAVSPPPMELGTVIEGMTVIGAIRLADSDDHLPGRHVVLAYGAGEFVTWEVAWFAGEWATTAASHLTNRSEAIRDLAIRADYSEWEK